LDFWSHYNAIIIEVLVSLILVSTIYLVYRTFFGVKGEGALQASGPSGAVAVNTEHIEKSLQKILENQATLKSTSQAVADQGGATAELVQELGNLKKALEEKEKQIGLLQDKAAQAMKTAKSSEANPSAEAIAAAASAAAGLAEKEREDYESKIKELQGRLAEYEIISEDIADLSFFKEENARLTKELEALRGGSGSGSGSASATATAGDTGGETAAPSAAQPEMATPEKVTEEAIAEVLGQETTVESAAPAGGAEALDDSLMAEFAKAVEGQKAEAAASPTTEDHDKLLEEFENFNKKS